MNVRGLGAGAKKRKIRELIKGEKIEVLALQETKTEGVDSRFCASLWGGDDVGWCSAPSIGRGGGLITLWDSTKGSFVKSFHGHGFLGVCLEWGVHKKSCIIINVYAPCDLLNKKRLWVDVLVAKHGEVAEFWCVLGDFNSVRGVEERNRCGPVTSPVMLVDKINLLFFQQIKPIIANFVRSSVWKWKIIRI
ncbi:DNA-(apurinic or apyrimidinic site) endonuclease [Trifolium repens]|nr:DNA-(apurinic or apyrimidinic site) endonuclease [Trifolium repens]